MKFNAKTLVSNLYHHLTKFVSGILILALMWQVASLGGSHGISFQESYVNASPLLATSTSSISKQVSGKGEEMKGSAKQKIGKAQSAIEDKASAAKMKIKDDMNEAKIAVDSNAARVENTGEKAVTAVKDFLGK
ncbi:MAG: hypothetical protein WCD18_12350 [Thermosynechococcaceae cyanobacterium]